MLTLDSRRCRTSWGTHAANFGPFAIPGLLKSSTAFWSASAYLFQNSRSWISCNDSLNTQPQEAPQWHVWKSFEMSALKILQWFVAARMVEFVLEKDNADETGRSKTIFWIISVGSISRLGFESSIFRIDCNWFLVEFYFWGEAIVYKVEGSRVTYEHSLLVRKTQCTGQPSLGFATFYFALYLERVAPSYFDMISYISSYRCFWRRGANTLCYKTELSRGNYPKVLPVTKRRPLLYRFALKSRLHDNVLVQIIRESWSTEIRFNSNTTFFHAYNRIQSTQRGFGFQLQKSLSHQLFWLWRKIINLPRSVPFLVKNARSFDTKPQPTVSFVPKVGPKLSENKHCENTLPSSPW